MKIEYFKENEEWKIKCDGVEKFKILKIANCLQSKEMTIKYIEPNILVCEGLKDSLNVKSEDIVKGIINFIKNNI